jgi:signal transduction histidine kinase
MEAKENIPRLKRTFLQPLAVALVSAIFIILILTMGIADIRRSERSLIGFMEDQGRRVIGVVEKLTEENLKNMIIASQKTAGSGPISLKEPIFSPDELLTEKIITMGREIDDHWKKEHLSASYISSFASARSLWLVAVLNDRGDVIFQSRPVGSQVKPDSDSSTKGKSIHRAAELIKILNEMNRRQEIGYIALKRKDQTGTIIIALDRDSMRYWGLRVSVERAIEKLGEGQGLVYLDIRDKDGKHLGGVGCIADKRDRDDSQIDGILSGIKKWSSTTVENAQTSVQEIVSLFHIGKEAAGTIRLGIDRGNADQIIRENRINVYLFLVFVVIITLVSMLFLYINQNRHLARIVEMTRKLDKAERLSSLGQLAAGVAHEIRNPLNAISMASQRLKREFAPAEEEKNEEFTTITTVIRDEIRRLNGIIEEFLTFSKSRRLELRDNAVQDVLMKIVNLVSAEAADHGVLIKTDWPNDPVVIPMDMDKLQQALLNLVKNAVESIDGDGRVTMTLQHETTGAAKITIAATGCGLTPDEIERIFNPEYTTKEKGLGLGLSLAHEIIRGHGGEIRVKSRKGEGTMFEILLPRERYDGKGATI